jgi:quercetin dioxygenase-like cupin family protein
MRQQAPLLPLCATETTRSRPVQLFSKQFQKECSPKFMAPGFGRWHHDGTMADSETLKAKNVDSADETRTFDNGKIDIVSIDELTAGRFTLEPGWRWSENIKPIVGTGSCQLLHTGYVVSGRMHLVHDDGSEQELGPGDVYIIRPGHDARNVGERLTLGSTSQARQSATPRRDKVGGIRSGHSSERLGSYGASAFFLTLPT